MKDCKIYVDGRSKEVQEKLFEMGCKWDGGTTDVVNAHQPFLYVNNNKITCSTDMEYFSKHPNPEIKVDELLAMKVEHEFKTGEDVLVRDEDDDEWCYAWFSHSLKAPKDYKYVVAPGSYYMQCIPYKGNEHLVGTKKDK